MYGSYSRGLYSASWLWTFWTLHVILLILELCCITYLTLDYSGQHNDVDGVHALILSFEFINFISEPVEMVLWSYHLLEPWLYLILQVLKSLFWTILAAASIWYISQPEHQTISVVEVLLYLLFTLTAISFYASLIYVSMIFARSRSRGGYWLPSDSQKAWRRKFLESEKIKSQSTVFMSDRDHA